MTRYLYTLTTMLDGYIYPTYWGLRLKPDAGPPRRYPMLRHLYLSPETVAAAHRALQFEPDAIRVTRDAIRRLMHDPIMAEAIGAFAKHPFFWQIGLKYNLPGDAMDWHYDSNARARIRTDHPGIPPGTMLNFSIGLSAKDAYEGGALETRGPERAMNASYRLGVGDMVISPGLRHRVTETTAGLRCMIVGVGVRSPLGGPSEGDLPQYGCER